MCMCTQVISLTLLDPMDQSMGFSRQEYWSRLPFLPPGDILDPGIEPTFPGSPALASRSLLTPQEVYYSLDSSG